MQTWVLKHHYNAILDLTKTKFATYETFIIFWQSRIQLQTFAVFWLQPIVFPKHCSHVLVCGSNYYSTRIYWTNCRIWCIGLLILYLVPLLKLWVNVKMWLVELVLPPCYHCDFSVTFSTSYRYMLIPPFLILLEYRTFCCWAFSFLLWSKMCQLSSLRSFFVFF